MKMRAKKTVELIEKLLIQGNLATIGRYQEILSEIGELEALADMKEAAERRAEIAEKALEIACIEIVDEFSLIIYQDDVEYKINDFKGKAENALRESEG